MAQLLNNRVRHRLVNVDAYEAKAGLEQLCATLSDEGEPLTPAEAALTHQTGMALGLTRASFLGIDELVVGA
jgi:hypothetical protein